jgi:hypothetical protein
VFGSVTTQLNKIENLEFQRNIDAVYYNGREPNLFRTHVSVMLGDLKHQLTQLNSRLHFCERGDDKVEEINYLNLSVFAFLFTVFNLCML